MLCARKNGSCGAALREDLVSQILRSFCIAHPGTKLSFSALVPHPEIESPILALASLRAGDHCRASAQPGDSHLRLGLL